MGRALEFGKVCLLQHLSGEYWDGSFRGVVREAMLDTVMLTQVGERSIYGADYVQEITERIRVLKLNMKEAQNRQRSYADKRRKELEFEVGDSVSQDGHVARSEQVYLRD